MQKLKQTMRSFMNGRNGSDPFGLALIWTGLACYIIGSIVGSIANTVCYTIGSLLNAVGFVAYFYALFRMFSRNLYKRRAENTRYLTLMGQSKIKVKQAKARHNNRKIYRYFKCPGCKSWLRLKRGTGVSTITCSRCHTSFTQKG